MINKQVYNVQTCMPYTSAQYYEVQQVLSVHIRIELTLI